MSVSICRDGACTTTQQPYPAFLPCDHVHDFSHAIDLATAFLVVMIGIYGLKTLLGLFDGRFDRD
jgi:hypothetical protein